MASQAARSSKPPSSQSMGLRSSLPSSSQSMGLRRSQASSSCLVSSTASTSTAGHPREGSYEPHGAGDVCLHSGAPARLDGAAQAHQDGASEGPASTGLPAEVGLTGAIKVASSELGGLAAALATDATSRQALQAAAAACETAEVFTPADLALAGSGDVLPQCTRDLILGGCTVHGAEQALEDLFVTSRNGLEGALALLSRRLASRGRSPASTTLDVACMGIPRSSAERRIMSAVTGPALPLSKRQRKVAKAEDPSLREKEGAKFKAALARCFALLDELGDKSPRFAKVSAARKAGTQGAVRLQENTFIGRFSSFRSLDTARRKFEAFVTFFTGLKLNPFSPPSGIWPLGSQTKQRREPAVRAAPSRPWRGQRKRSSSTWASLHHWSRPNV